MFCREIKPLVSEYCETLGRIVTSRCNDAVEISIALKINIIETSISIALKSFIGWHYDFLKHFWNVLVNGS